MPTVYESNPARAGAPSQTGRRVGTQYAVALFIGDEWAECRFSCAKPVYRLDGRQFQSPRSADEAADIVRQRLTKAGYDIVEVLPSMTVLALVREPSC